MPASGGTQSYVVRQLQSWDDKGWAVISLPAGAIVLRNDRLLMKLTEAEAERLAAELNAELDVDPEG